MPVRVRKVLKVFGDLGVEVDTAGGKGSHRKLRYGSNTTILAAHGKDVPEFHLKGWCRQLGLDYADVLKRLGR